MSKVKMVTFEVGVKLSKHYNSYEMRVGVEVEVAENDSIESVIDTYRERIQNKIEVEVLKVAEIGLK